MTRHVRAALVLVAVLCQPVRAAPVPGDDGCVTFVGDVTLARGVRRELFRDPRSPWAGFSFAPGDAWVGNLEGAVEPGAGQGCKKPPALCLGMAPGDIPLLRGAPFVGLSLANNHSRDFGEAGYQATARALEQAGLLALTEEGAPHLRQIAGRWWAFVPINLIDRPLTDVSQALVRARMQIGLARASTPRVVVLPHWGKEYDPRPGPEQEQLARLFHDWGALLVVGAHAHVPQGHLCQKDGDGATYYGLGNHLFDQAQRETHHGQALRCCPAGPTAEGLSCTTFATVRDADSTHPRPQAQNPGTDRCDVLDPGPTPTSWQAHRGRRRFLFVQPFRSLGREVYLALHRHYAEFDHEDALRPYVFRVDDGGHTVDLWRGTALAWPLLAARLIQVEGREYLCALHRGDSYLEPNPDAPGRRHVIYEWGGFGFHTVQNEKAQDRCQEL